MVHTELNDCRNYYKTIVLNKRQECDFELIVNGGFSPLTGFLNKSDYETVVNTMRLSNGALWSMPPTQRANAPWLAYYCRLESQVVCHAPLFCIMRL